jgi:hypothetical protein
MPTKRKASKRPPTPKSHATKVRRLPPTPDYLRFLPSSNLRGRDWRRILKFVLRRVAVQRPSLAKELTRDVRIFHALRVSPPPLVDVNYLLPRWLRQDAPLIPRPTKLHAKYETFMKVRDVLTKVPRADWPTWLADLENFNENEAERLTAKDIADIVQACRTAVQCALEAVATVYGQDPGNLKVQFANAGLPLRPFAPRGPQSPRIKTRSRRPR